MANTTVASANQVDQWSKEFFREWNRENQFSAYMGKSVNSPIQIKEELNKKPGDDLTISLVTNLSGSGVTGDNTLRGNEEALGNYGYKLTIDQLRNAVRFGKMEQKKTAIDLFMAAKEMLKPWRMNALRDDIIAAMQCPVVDGSTAYGSASEAEKDAWLAANDDRILFGAAKSNNSSNDHSASLLNVDATNDVLTPTIISLAKRMVKLADPKIRPISTKKGGQEFYIMFANSYAFRDLSQNSTMTQANRDARVRGLENPLFKGGDLWWDGILVHEVPEIPVISGVGAAGIDVAPNFICGAQALGRAIGDPTHFVQEMQDYDNLKGIGVSDIESVQKLMYNDIQHGMLTLYTAGVADT